MKKLSKGKKTLLITWLIIIIYGWGYYFLIESPFNYSPSESIPIFFAGISIVFSIIFMIILLVIYIIENW